MRIIFTEGPEVYDTDGQGQIHRGIAREIDDQYGFDLIKRGAVVAADTASQDKFRAMLGETTQDPAVTAGETTITEE